jgi:hypothetical protein
MTRQVPSPQDLHGEALTLVEDLRAYLWAYREAYRVAFEPVVGDGSIPNRGGTSTPTETTALAGRQRRLRRDLTTSAEKIHDAAADLRAANYVVRRGMWADGIDPLADGDRMHREEREGAYGSLLSPAEKARLQEYKRQREGGP